MKLQPGWSLPPPGQDRISVDELLGKTPRQQATPAPAPKSKAMRRGSMNRTEERRAHELAALERSGEIARWAFEGVKLRLATGAWYTPDFAVWGLDGRLAFEEVKGFWREAARVRIKVAARLYPEITFVALRRKRKKDGGGWEREEIRNGGPTP